MIFRNFRNQSPKTFSIEGAKLLSKEKAFNIYILSKNLHTFAFKDEKLVVVEVS